MIPPSHQPRISYAGYAHILAAMPGTAIEISERCGIAAEGCRRVCREMITLRIAHRSCVRSVGVRNSKAAVYSAGAGPNTKIPQGKENIRPRSKLIAFASIIRALEHESTQTEIQAETGVTHTAVCRLLRVMRQLNLARICGYQRTKSGVKPAIWALGSAKNANKPKAKDRKTLNAEYAQRKKDAEHARKLMIALVARSSVFELANV